MNKRVSQILARFDQQAIRSRILITLAAVVLVVFLVDWVWIAPNAGESKKLRSELTALETETQQLNIKQNELNASFANQRNHPVRKQLQSIEKLIRKTQAELEAKTINLVKPEQMASVLKEIIARSKAMKLITLTKQPAEELFSQTDKKQQQKTQVYRHPVEIVLQGKFADTRKFLQSLESMPQKVNFDALDFAVERHPKSTVTLVVSTLSLERKWIGG